MKKITLIAAAAAVAVSTSAQTYNTDKVTTAQALEGFEKATIDYIVLDDNVVSLLQNDPKYTLNPCGPDDVVNFLYVWDGTFAGGASTEPGADGGFGYLSLDVTNVGWSGAGYCANAGSKVSTQHFTDETIFHLAYRTNNQCASFCHNILPSGGVEAKIALGTNPNEPTYKLFGNAPTEEWQAIEIKLGDLKKEFPGWDYKNWKEGNYLTALAGGVQGQNISLDAVYFVTPNVGSALETIDVDPNETPVYYNLQGQKVNNPENGIFIKKVGKTAEKVVL